MSEKRGSVLIVDDDADILLSAKIVLKRIVSRVVTTSDPHRIADLLEREPFDLVLLDMNFTRGFTTGKEGIRWLRKIRKIRPGTAVIMMTAYGEVELAVRAMKEGARDFVVKPWENDDLKDRVRHAIDNPEPVAQSEQQAQEAASGMWGTSPEMERVRGVIQKVAATDASVLILGENGTGKEVAARAIHDASPRKNEAFVHVDLGAVPESLFESELFGHVAGAFTDARTDRLGRFEAAAGGTLFLDEIGNVSPAMQAKLLTVLQNRRIVRVGSNTPVDIDVRLICATNQPIYEQVRDQKFRQDLLYRINTVEITLPPLRERSGDVELLAEKFLARYTKKYDRPGLKLTADARRKLRAYAWPGNIRELQHTLERAVIMAEGDRVSPDELSIRETSTEIASKKPQATLKLEEIERDAIRAALRQHGGNVSQAAKALGLGRTTLYRKMQKYDL